MSHNKGKFIVLLSKSTLYYSNNMKESGFESSESFKDGGGGGVVIGHPVYCTHYLNPEVFLRVGVHLTSDRS